MHKVVEFVGMAGEFAIQKHSGEFLGSANPQFAKGPGRHGNFLHGPADFGELARRHLYFLAEVFITGIDQF